MTTALATASPLQMPFSNVQLEILKAFSYQLSEQQLLNLRKTLAHFFAQIAIEEANRVWDEKGWTDTDAEQMMQTKMRRRRKQKTT